MVAPGMSAARILSRRGPFARGVPVAPHALLGLLRPLHRHLTVQLVEAEIGVHFVDGPLAIRGHFRGDLAVAGEQRPADGVELVRQQVDVAAASTRTGALLIDAPRRPRSTRASRSHVRPPATRPAQVAHGRVQGDCRIGRSLIDDIDERLQPDWIFESKDRSLDLGGGNEPATPARRHPGHDGIGELGPRREGESALTQLRAPRPGGAADGRAPWGAQRWPARRHR